MYLELLLCMSPSEKLIPKDEALALVVQNPDKATCIHPKNRYTAGKCKTYYAIHWIAIYQWVELSSFQPTRAWFESTKLMFTFSLRINPKQRMPKEKFENMGGEVNIWTKFEPKATGESDMRLTNIFAEF